MIVNAKNLSNTHRNVLMLKTQHDDEDFGMQQSYLDLIFFALSSIFQTPELI